MSDSFINTPEWAAAIKGTLRAEMARHSVTYAELSRRLDSRFGTKQSESNLKAKVNKGVLGAQLFVQILAVLGSEVLDIGQITKLTRENSKP